MAFFKKFSIDFNRAALWGIHCIPREQENLIEFKCKIGEGKKCVLMLGLWVPARGVLAALLCARGSSGLEPDDVDGPGLLSMATSDTGEYTRWAI